MTVSSTPLRPTLMVWKPRGGFGGSVSVGVIGSCVGVSFGIVVVAAVVVAAVVVAAVVVAAVVDVVLAFWQGFLVAGARGSNLIFSK